MWFGLLLVFLLVCWSGARDGRPIPLFFMVFPVVMGVIGYFIMKKMIFDLVDEVYDFGEYLVVKNNNEEDKVLLSNIRNVSYSYLINPKRVTLSLREPILFGKEISFSPPVMMTLNPFQKNPLIEELIERIDKARLK